MNRPVRNGLVFLNGVGLAVLLIIASYYRWFEKPYLRYINLPFPIAQPVIPAGTSVAIKVIRCSDDPNTRIYNFSRTLVSDDGAQPQLTKIVLPSGQSAVEPGCGEITDVVLISTSVPPGRYHFEGVAEIPGTWHVFLLTRVSATFTVVAPPIPTVILKQ